MHVVLLANPAARAGRHRHAVARASARMRERGIRVTVLSGGSASETTELLRAALRQRPDAVAVAGGDGTVHLAVQELAGGDIPLGIIPCGTGNDLARTLGVRELHPEAAADVIADGSIRRIDLARLTRDDGFDRLFATVLASGFDARVNDRANRMRWPRGRSRYTAAILIEFLRLRHHSVALTAQTPDGGAFRVAGPVTLVAVGNARSYGGGIPMCPDADPADGLLDLTVVQPVGRLQLLRLLPRAYRGTHTTLTQVSTLRVRSVRVGERGLNAYADGEAMGPLPVTVEIVAGALRVFAPVR